MNQPLDFRGQGKRVLACLLVLCIALCASACRPTAKLDSETIQSVVRVILEQQVRDWNDGNVEMFMRGYAQSDSTRFASGGEVFKGWQAVLDRYKQKYPNQAAMGKLTFSDVDVTVLCPTGALAFGRWQLQGVNGDSSGLFTLLFRETPDGWRIVHDHTSAAAKK